MDAGILAPSLRGDMIFTFGSVANSPSPDRLPERYNPPANVVVEAVEEGGNRGRGGRGRGGLTTGRGRGARNRRPRKGRGGNDEGSRGSNTFRVLLEGSDQLVVVNLTGSEARSYDSAAQAIINVVFYRVDQRAPHRDDVVIMGYDAAFQQFVAIEDGDLEELLSCKKLRLSLRGSTTRRGGGRRDDHDDGEGRRFGKRQRDDRREDSDDERDRDNRPRGAFDRAGTRWGHAERDDNSLPQRRVRADPYSVGALAVLVQKAEQRGIAPKNAYSVAAREWKQMGADEKKRRRGIRVKAERTGILDSWKVDGLDNLHVKLTREGEDLADDELDRRQ